MKHLTYGQAVTILIIAAIIAIFVLAAIASGHAT
jgi:hypothetical protein